MNEENEPLSNEDEYLEPESDTIDDVTDADSGDFSPQIDVDIVEADSYEDDDPTDIMDENMLGGVLDIDAALASVGTLEAELAEREAQEQAERERFEAQRRAIEEEVARRASHYFPRPPLMLLKRGQMASVIPALVLIAVGAWLTMTLTTNEGELPTGLALIVGIASLGIVMVTQWFTSDRWSRGTGFVGLTLLMGSGLLIFLGGDSQLSQDGYPLFIVVLGLSMLLVQFLSQPIGINLTFIGITFIVAGIVGLMVSTDVINGSQWVDIAEVIWIPAILLLIIMIFLPLILNRRRSE